MCDILAVLFKGVINLNLENFKKLDRDKFILSKGHSTLSYYAVLKELGFITKQELANYEGEGSFLFGHPVRNLEKGIEYSTGSLGQGISLGVGVALADRLKKNNNKIYVIVGDGECNEGSVWEAAMTISHHKLKNISIILDVNGFQQTGRTKEILNLINLKKKWKRFGWETLSINGHDFKQIKKAINKKTELPKVIIAKTKKGAGVKEFENNNTWHHNILTKSKYQQIIKKIN